MPEEHGLYLTLLPKGHIKRDLAGPAGEVPLDETTIQDELILFSELNFETYAQVVDMIRTSVRFLYVDDHGNRDEVNPDVYQFILETATDLANTLMEEHPLHGLLLWTALEDQLAPNDGLPDYQLRHCRKLLAVLIEPMHFQFIINEVLYDLREKEPLDPEKYEGFWEMPVTEIVSVGEELTTRYHFRSAVDYYHFLLLHFVVSKPNVTLCECCGRFFVPKTKKTTIYCDRILKDEKTCKEWGPVLKHRLAAKQNEVIQAFDRAKRKMYKRYERATYVNQKPSEKDLSYAEYYEWLDKATQARDDYLAGRVSRENAIKIINGN